MRKPQPVGEESRSDHRPKTINLAYKLRKALPHLETEQQPLGITPTATPRPDNIFSPRSPTCPHHPWELAEEVGKDLFEAAKCDSPMGMTYSTAGLHRSRPTVFVPSRGLRCRAANSLPKSSAIPLLDIVSHLIVHRRRPSIADNWMPQLRKVSILSVLSSSPQAKMRRAQTG